MDDWNDFGTAPVAPPPVHSPVYPSSSSHTSLDSPSDASGLLPSSPSGSSTYSSPNVRPTNPQRTDNHRDTNHSFLSSLPFLGSTAVRLRRADRQATAAAAAASAAAALAGGTLTHPTVVVPVTRSEMSDRSNDDFEGVSVASETDDAREPPSRMLPRTAANLNVSDPHYDSRFQSDEYEFKPHHGDLDDVPDDFEFNIEGFRYRRINAPSSVDDVEDGQSSAIASSLFNPMDRSYTKLEVISAKQIKNLVLFFNLFVVISIFFTIFCVIMTNTLFKVTGGVPLPGPLLHEEQIENAPGPPVLYPAQCPPKCAEEPRRHATFKSMDGKRQQLFPPDFLKDFYKSLNDVGVHLTSGGILQDQTERFVSPPEVLDTSHSERMNWHSILSHDLKNSATFPLKRQDDGSGNQEAEEGDTGADSEPVGEGGGVPAIPSDLTYVYAYVQDITYAVAQRWYLNLSHAFSMCFAVFFIILAILYGIRLLRQGRRNITHEQGWVFILIVVAGLYFNPMQNINQLIEINWPEGPTNFTDFPAWFNNWGRINDVIRDVAFTFFSFFYLWISLHSYRILDPTKRLGWAFYIPKLFVLSMYAIYKLLAFWILDIFLSEVPLLSAPALAFTFAEYRIWNYLKAELLYCVGASVSELVLIGVIVFEALKTMHVLEKAPYMKHRTKRVGFRFFLYTNFVFYPLFIALNLLLLLAIPRGENIILLVIGFNTPRADVLWTHSLGPHFLLVGYVLVTAYVHLPYNCVGVLRGWFVSSELAESGSRWSFTSSESESTRQSSSMTGFKGYITPKSMPWVNDEDSPRSVVDNDDELEQQIVEPITYRKRESKDSLELKANCFTMQTHVIMFNFAWYVYYYGTSKLDSFRPRENPLPFEYTIAAHIRCETTDTQALVVDCSDRIIVTFKGTTSMRNLKTSLRMSHEYLRNVVNCSVYGEDETMRLKRLFGRRYLNGKIHKGFAIAYKSVSDEVMENVRKLRARRQRPVFLTGHSLGGALATICSLDIWVKLDVSRREIFVSTFGSPRVGNQDFANVYREVVPLHWRIVVDPDMVAKLPNVGYTHVGKKVVLTPHGEMIIDPNALEQRPWTGEAAGFAYHRKASYLLAMRAWCVRNHGMTYTPVFWPFPVRPEDKRRFAGAFPDEEDRAGYKVASKIIRMDAMVDALGAGEIELANMAVVEKWARLTRRLLLNETLAAGVSGVGPV